MIKLARLTIYLGCTLAGMAGLYWQVPYSGWVLTVGLLGLVVE